VLVHQTRTVPGPVVLVIARESLLFLLFQGHHSTYLSDFRQGVFFFKGRHELLGEKEGLICALLVVVKGCASSCYRGRCLFVLVGKLALRRFSLCDLPRLHVFWCPGTANYTFLRVSHDLMMMCLIHSLLAPGFAWLSLLHTR
jgi:hypothetical protein